ncbi:MAG: hypothetical protein ACK5LE_09810, partial [Alphaproteobacteria bacterium]
MQKKIKPPLINNYTSLINHVFSYWPMPVEADSNILITNNVKGNEEKIDLQIELELEKSDNLNQDILSNYHPIYENRYSITSIESFELQKPSALLIYSPYNIFLIPEASDQDNKMSINMVGVNDFNIDNLIFDRYSGGHIVTMGAEDNSVTIWFGENTIDTGAGDDVITLFHGGNIIDAGEGNDIIRLFGGESDFIYNLGDGNDSLYGNANILFGEGITLADLSIESYVIDIAGQGSINVEGYKGQSLIFSDGTSISYEDFTALFSHPSDNILEIEPVFGMDDYLYESEFGNPIVVCEFLAEANI